jgi:hypothetical protein
MLRRFSEWSHMDMVTRTVNLFSTHRSHPEQPAAQEFFVIFR